MAQRYFIVMEEEEENADGAGVGYWEGRGRASAEILHLEKNAHVKELEEHPWGGKRGGGEGEREKGAGRGSGKEATGGRQDGGGDEAGRNNLCGV